MRRFLFFFLSLALLLTLCCACGRKDTDTVIEMSPTAAPEETVSDDSHAGEVEVLDGGNGTMWAPEAQSWDVFELDRNAFDVGDDYARYNGTGWNLRRGIDVSAYQGNIDWNAVKASGIEFVIIRCAWRGAGEGTLSEDAMFRSNIEGALAAGLEVGVYTFSQATSVIEAAEEAVFTVKLLEDYDISLPVFFDWEHYDSPNARTNDMDSETLTDCALEFCHLIRSAGYTPGIYSYMTLAYYEYNLEELAGLTLWISNPSSYPEFYYDHQYWQYSTSGSVAGIDGFVDLNIEYIKEDTTE